MHARYVIFVIDASRWRYENKHKGRQGLGRTDVPKLKKVKELKAKQKNKEKRPARGGGG